MWKPYKPHPECFKDEEIVLSVPENSDDIWSCDIPEFDFFRVVSDDDKFKIEFVKLHKNENLYKQALATYEIDIKRYRQYLQEQIAIKERELKYMR